MNVEPYRVTRSGRLVEVPPAVPHYLVGLDLGQAADYSALALVEQLDADTDAARYDTVGLKRWPLGTSYPRIVADVNGLLGREPLSTGTTALVIDGTGVGRPVMDMFVLAGLRPVPIVITGGSTVTSERGGYHVPKRDLVSVLRVLSQTGRLKVAAGLAEAETLTREMQQFEIKISDAGRDSYGSWREGAHDDLVLALAVACWLGEWQPTRTIEPLDTELKATLAKFTGR